MQNSINYGRMEQRDLLKGFRYSANMQRAIRDRFVDLLVISIPALRFLEFKIVGRLFAPEIILISLFPILLFYNRNLLFKSLSKMMILFMLVWLVGQIVTDLIRYIPFEDYIRGWAKIGITIINFAVIYILTYDSRRRIVLYAIGIALGGILSFYFHPSIYVEDYPWKFGIGETFTWILIISTCGVRKHWILVRLGLIVIASGLNLYMCYRSYAGICFLTAVYISLKWLISKKDTQKLKLSPKNMLIIGLVVLTASFVFIKGYEHLASEGLLGEKARQNYEWQATGEFGLLLGGRSEILASGLAIWDSPIIGHGSWAKDYRYYDYLVYLKRMLGYYPGLSNELGLIPTHSHLFGAWVEAGILGAVFWIWVLYLTIRRMVMLIRTKEVLTPLFVFIGFILIWDIFFSPFGAERRFMTPYYIIVMMNLLPSRVKKKNRIKL